MRLTPSAAEWGCLPEGGGAQTLNGCVFMPFEGVPFEIDCLRMSLCQQPSACTCSENGCVATEPAQIVFELNVVGAGDQLEGTVQLRGESHTVLLARTP